MAKNKAKAVTQQQSIQSSKTPIKKEIPASKKTNQFYFMTEINK